MHRLIFIVVLDLNYIIMSGGRYLYLKFRKNYKR